MTSLWPTCPSPLGLKWVGGTWALFCTGIPPLIEGFTGNVSTILPYDDAAVDDALAVSVPATQENPYSVTEHLSRQNASFPN